jgi:dipeptidyl aminopeptidase/acylaminoacyl peptidase
VESFAAGSSMQSPSLSNDGRRLAYIAYVDGKPIVVVRELPGGKPQPVLNGLVDVFRVQRCWFKNPERLVCHFAGHDFDAGRPFSISRLYSMDADGRNGKVLVVNTKAGGSQFQDQILHELPNDRENVLIQLATDVEIFPAVYKLNVYTGRSQIVLRARDPVMRWLPDRDGVVRFGYGYTDRKGLYLARNSADDSWRTLARFARFDGENWSPVGFGVLPNSLLVFASHNGRTALFDMDLDDNADRQLLFSHPRHDVDDFVVWPGSRRIVGVVYETDRPKLDLFDPEAAIIQKAIDGNLPNTFNRVIDGSDDGKKLLIMSYSDIQPVKYSLLDLQARTLVEVGRDSRSLVPESLAKMQTIEVPGPNGIKIPGYLTKPLGKETRGLPTIVMPHGGPIARDSWGYDPVLQFLVNRGYAVLQLNFRGSSGYGDEWQLAGRQGWGTVMHDDITAGARHLIEKGIADPKRLCIVGWSYGGYAALIGAVKEPELYRCAVSIAGVSDISSLQWDDRRFYGAAAGLRDQTGTEDLAAQSPRRRAAEIKVPVLLVHGTADVNVLVNHSRDMAKALERNNKKHELIVIKDGDHSLLDPTMRLTLFQALERFLGEHLPSH